jgi:hypothetical protein
MKVNCPFQLRGSVPTSKKVASKTWTLETRNGKHNHNPSPGAGAHSAHRQLLPNQVEEICKLSKAKLKPAQILLQLQTSNKEILEPNKTISNTLQKILSEDLAGQTPIEALMCILKESNCSCNVKLSSTGKILNLFFPTPDQSTLLALTTMLHYWTRRTKQTDTNCLYYTSLARPPPTDL